MSNVKSDGESAVREFNQEERLKRAMRDLGEAERENERLRKEVTALAIESIEREKTLAKLEAEVMAWAKAEPEEVEP